MNLDWVCYNGRMELYWDDMDREFIEICSEIYFLQFEFENKKKQKGIKKWK